MKAKSFGIVNQTTLDNELDQYFEELIISGFTVIENVLSAEELIIARKKVDEVYDRQVSEFSEENLKAINELNIARLLLAYDDYFIELLRKEIVLDMLRKILGNYFVLHLQNGIINRPDEGHHQNSWHRDLPYQEFVISKPLAISALYCIDDFNESTGGTVVIPFTHKSEQMPSEQYMSKYAKQITASAGSIILFDSMIFHKAGYNSSNQIRRGINQMFTSAILKQQINIPESIKGKFNDDPLLKMLLGYEATPAKSVFDWRNTKLKK